MIDYVLKISYERKCPVTIVYQQDQKISQRKIKVFDFSGENVRAFCFMRKQIRIFKKENILSASYDSYFDNEQILAEEYSDNIMLAIAAN